KRLAWLAGGGGPPFAATSSLTTMSGRIPASSHASSALSTASFTQVKRALRGLSKPRRGRFLVENSEAEVSRWRAAISTAETGGLGVGAVAGFAGSLGTAARFAVSVADAGSGRLFFRFGLANGALDGSHIPHIQTKSGRRTQVFLQPHPRVKTRPHPRLR